MRFVDPLADPRWDERLLAHDDASVFHTAGWARVLRDSYGYTGDYLVETEGERIVFLLPLMDVRSILTGRRGVSLPFTDFCEPLVDGCGPVADVLQALVELGRRRRWKYFEVRGGERLFSGREPATTVFSHTLDLSVPEAELLERMRPGKRRNIRSARSRGVTVSIGESLKLVEDFYRLFCRTRREHGLPPQSLSFFRGVYRDLLATGQGCIALATVGGAPAAGALFLHFGGKAIFKYGASDRRFLSHRPNELVMWEAIRWCRRRGFRQLSFGRTERGHEGLRRYKVGWGGEERVQPCYRFDFREGAFGASPRRIWDVPRGLFRLMPIPVSRVLGKVLYRHVA